jgi:3-phenylpropionate/cinnamic acid dioxygenase small subunit
MSNRSLKLKPRKQRALERFYFYEARLLDSRQYQQWLALVDPEVRYTMPSRTNPMVDNRERGAESMISVERELEGADSPGCPLREETYVHLMLRVERAYKINSWAEHPPARTRRLVGNIELMGKQGRELSVLSNFHLYYTRPGSASAFYSGQRRDVLRRVEEGFRILKREVVMDYADIELPTLGLLL